MNSTNIHYFSLRNFPSRFVFQPLGFSSLTAACLIAGLAVSAPAQTRYELRAGTSVEISADSATQDFMLKAASRRLTLPDGTTAGLTVGLNETGDKMMLAAPLRTKPGEYAVTVSSTSDKGVEQKTTMDVVVDALPTVPASATRPPVVLLNGWQTLYTNNCPVATNSTTTFGKLAQYLLSDGVPQVYFFDNCAEDPNQPIETLAADFGKFMNSITYDDGTPVTQIDVVGFSLGGLIVRTYLAGLQLNGTLSPPANTLVRKLVLIATPNFGSFLATNSASVIISGTQSAEILTASAFLWNLNTWNQRVDDLRGVNAIAVIGNAGTYINYLTGASLANGSDGVVGLTSGSLSFVAQQPLVTRIVPYCQVDPSAFTNQNLAYSCTAAGIANVSNVNQFTGQIVRTWLADAPDWQNIGTSPATDPLLSVNGGTFFGMVNQNDAQVTDMTQVFWGSLTLQNGGATNTIFYNDFVYGTGAFTATSSSLGSIMCGTVTEAVGYFNAARCKIGTAIISVGPLLPGAAHVVGAGSAITITGATFGFLCNGCKVTATPVGTTSTQSLTVSSWTDTWITAQLPAGLNGLVNIAVLGVNGNDTINAMVATRPAIAVSSGSLQFSATGSQTVQITNGGNGPLAWTATASDPWLSGSPASGTAPSTLTVSVSTTGLSAGTYTGSVQIAAVGASNTPLSIPVSLTVAAAPASLVVAPQSLTYQYTFGGAVPAAQGISITNGGGGSFSWTASTSDYWLNVSAASGAAPASVSVSVDPSNLAAGTYNGSVQITAAGVSGSPATIAVTLTVQGNPPSGTITGITNAGSFQPGFASATWVSIFGTNLSQTTYTWQASDFVNGQLPTSLRGVSVTINGMPAYVEYISPTQINVLAPDDAATGSVQVQVTTAKQQSNSLAAQKQQFAPSFFTLDGTSVAAEHTDGTLISASSPAHPGETVQIYGTGFGPTNPATPTGQLVATPAMLANTVQMTIGGATATVVYGGLVEAGLNQLNVTIPASLPNGNAAITASIGGVQTQTGVSITVQQ
jgi:uncharacterized protein (TIGR03437 family)